jgi:hypothetical protein
MKKGLGYDERKMLLTEQTKGKLIINYENPKLYYFFCCILQLYETVMAVTQCQLKSNGNFLFSF